MEANFYQTYVATVNASNFWKILLPLLEIERSISLSDSFNTIKTVFPSEVLNATFGKLMVVLDAILIEPGLTNLEA